MKKGKKILSMALMAALVMIMFIPQTISAASRQDQTIVASNITVLVGDNSKKVNAKARTSLSYKSSDPSIVGVSPQGKLTPKRGGTVKLTVYAKATSKYNSTKKTITVKVNRKNQVITGANKTVYAGDAGKKIGAQGKTSLSYKSSNPSVCGISSNGVLTPKRAGTVKITIYAKATSKYNSAKKTVVVNIRGDWYKKVLNQKYGSYKVLSNRYGSTDFISKWVYRSDFTYYKVADINNDGIQELILATNRYNIGSDNRIFLLTYYEGRIKPLLCFEAAGARGHFFLTKNVLVATTGDTKGAMQFYFTVDKGKLVKKLYVGRVVYNHKKRIIWYFVNGKQTTKSAWEKARSRYPYSSGNEILFSRI